MNLYSKIRFYFYQNKIKKILEKATSNCNSTDLGRAKSIGILFDAAFKKEVLEYADELTSLGKKVQLLGYFNDKKERSKLPFHHFTNKHLSFAYIPNHKSVKDFTNHSFDILIGVFHQDNLPLEYICTSSKARFKIGKFTEKIHCFDLMIDTPHQDFDVENFFEEIEAILPIMKNRKYEPATV